MTSVSQTIHYTLGTPDDLSRLIDDLATIDARAVVVAFDSSDPAFPTDLQLARLVGVGWDRNKQLIIETGDSDLAERALMLGFDDSAMVSDAPGPEHSDTNAIEPVIVARADDPDERPGFDTTSNLSTYRPIPDQPAGSQEHHYRQTMNQTGTIHQVNARWTSPAANASAAGYHSKSSSEAPTSYIESPGRLRPASEQMEAGQSDSQNGARRKTRPRKQRSPRHRRALIAVAVVAPVMVIAVVAALAVYLLPTADVRIVPEEEAVASSLTYGLATDEASYDVTVDPSTTSNTTTAEATRETTGERFEPDGTAAGAVQITNPLTSEVTIPEGTEISGSNGVTYYTAGDLRIDAADPFGSMSFGSASVNIYAGIAGPDGNMDAGTLTGQLGNGLFYTNPGAISGGTMRRIAVILEEDLEAVEAEVEQDLTERAESEFMEAVPTRLELVPGSLEIGKPEIEVEGEAGADGEAVSATGSITVRAQVYDPEELHQAAGAEADRLLTREGQSEQILLADTIDMREPVSINDDDTAFRIDVEGTARTVISEAEREAIVQDLVGLSRADAEARLANHPKIESYEVAISPDWLPDRMPEILSRIDLSVSSSEQTTATR